MNPYFPINELDQGNYYIWSRQMRSLLRNVWRVIEEPRPLDNPAEWDALNAEALQVMAESVKDTQFCFIKNCETAASAWQNLKDVHDPSGPVNRVSLYKYLLGLQMAENGDAVDYLNVFCTTLDKLAGVGIKLEDGLAVVMLLASLPKEYESFVHAMQATNCLPTLEQLKFKMLAQDSRRHIESFSIYGEQETGQAWTLQAWPELNNRNTPEQQAYSLAISSARLISNMSPGALNDMYCVRKMTSNFVTEMEAIFSHDGNGRGETLHQSELDKVELASVSYVSDVKVTETYATKDLERKWDAELDSTFRNVANVYPLTESDVSEPDPPEENLLAIQPIVATGLECVAKEQLYKFLGSQNERNGGRHGIFKNQSMYINAMLEWDNLRSFRLSGTPLNAGFQMACSSSSCLIEEAAAYHSAIGELMWMAITARPDIYHAVVKMLQANRKQQPENTTRVAHIIRQLAGRVNLQVGSLVGGLGLCGGFVFFLEDGPIAWSLNRQSCVDWGSSEFEYLAPSSMKKRRCN